MNKYFIELRQRILQIFLAVIIIFLGLFLISNKLYIFLAQPLLKLLPSNSKLIATGVTTPFLVPLKLSFIAAITISMPYIIWHLWRFITPALYNNEKKFALKIVITSSLLFYLGTVFGFFILAPLALKFFIFAAPSEVAVMTDLQQYLDFMLSIIFAAGLAFQIPVITLVCIKLQLISKATLRQHRGWVIVAALTIGMLLTPPDVISQILLAIPIWLLFELGLLVA